MPHHIGGLTARSQQKQTVQGNLGAEGQPFICERPTLPVGAAQLQRLINEQILSELTEEEVVS